MKFNPYTRLLNEIKDHCSKIAFRRRLAMWYYSKARLGEGWRLTELYERTAAASQLGYEVVLEAKEDGLYVRYVEKVPATPWQWQ